MQKGKIYIETNGEDFNGNKYAVPTVELEDFDSVLNKIIYADTALEIHRLNKLFIERFGKYRITK